VTQFGLYPPLCELKKINSLRCYGHISRMSEERNSKEYFEKENVRKTKMTMGARD
jgi:hypothetical protein